MAVSHRCPAGVLKSGKFRGNLEKQSSYVITFTQDVHGEFGNMESQDCIEKTEQEWRQSSHMGRSLNRAAGLPVVSPLHCPNMSAQGPSTHRPGTEVK